MSALVDVTKENGVKDLPLNIRRWFAKAIPTEREAGHTTPEAEEYLQKAIDAEAESK